jgi:hypothetical protein
MAAYCVFQDFSQLNRDHDDRENRKSNMNYYCLIFDAMRIIPKFKEPRPHVFCPFMYHLPEIFYGTKVTMVDCISRISFEPYAKEIIKSNRLSFYYNYIFRKNRFIGKQFFIT